MSEQKRCPWCNCETEKAEFGCAVEIDSESIQQLLTKYELMEELNEDYEVIMKHFKSECNIVGIDERGEYLSFFLKNTITDDQILGRTFKYRPDPVAPAKWEPVFVFWPPSQDSELEVYRAFSLGMFHENGNLIVQYGDHEKWSADWCSVNDRNHHSHGWRKEWEPSE